MASFADVLPTLIAQQKNFNHAVNNDNKYTDTAPTSSCASTLTVTIFMIIVGVALLLACVFAIGLYYRSR
jgi:hypothetical protein